jgi:hypothetical protein
LYQPGASTDDSWNGLWGIVRGYNNSRLDLKTLPNNPNGRAPAVSNVGDFTGVCPKIAPVRPFDITAVLASKALPKATLVYNPRTSSVTNPLTGETHNGPLHDPTAIMYVRSSDLDFSNKLKPGVPVEPLILRANAGDCIEVTLNNKLQSLMPDLDGFNTLPFIVDFFNANQVKPSSHVGLHPQQFLFDVTRSNGINVGFNPVQTATPGNKTTYQWYAGDISIGPTGFASAVPIEFGATNLISSDPIKHSNKGAIGALIIEPKNTKWLEDSNSRARATIQTLTGSTLFREGVVLFQNDINLRYGDGTAVENLAGEDDAEDSAQKGLNYRTEPLWFRMGHAPETPFSVTRGFQWADVLSNTKIGADPVTPIFTAAAGQAMRFRVVHPGGHQRNNVFTLHGHVWQEEPFVESSTVLGSNPLSEWHGAQFGFGPTTHFNFLLANGAGGRFRVPGDYLYRTFESNQFDQGIWGLFRVFRVILLGNELDVPQQ